MVPSAKSSASEKEGICAFVSMCGGGGGGVCGLQEEKEGTGHCYTMLETEQRILGASPFTVRAAVALASYCGRIASRPST